MGDAVYPVPADWADTALVGEDRYHDLYRQSIEEPEAFWTREAARLDWITPFTRVKNTSFHRQDFGISWFSDGTLNLSANCLDRHLATRGDQIAILWEPDSPSEPERRITYRQLHEDVCRLANLLIEQGVQAGDRVTIYLPMVPEAAVAMLACARIGAIHSIVFAGFSPEALAGRVEDCDSRIILTADEGLRGGKRVPLKANVDLALTHCTGVRTVVVLARTGADVPMVAGRDIDWHRGVARQSPICPPRDEGRRPALHPLHLRLHRQAQGRAPHHRRLQRLGRHDA
jgi:acetyl-CoA synthetase